VLPFVLAALALMHLIALHDSAGSNNPLGVSGNYDRIPFAPYFLFAATPFDQSPLRRILSRRISRQMKMMLLKMTWMMKWLISSWMKRKLMGMAKL
jgi:hypothetical protein